MTVVTEGGGDWSGFPNIIVVSTCGQSCGSRMVVVIRGGGVTTTVVPVRCSVKVFVMVRVPGAFLGTTAWVTGVLPVTTACVSGEPFSMTA